MAMRVLLLAVVVGCKQFSLTSQVQQEEAKPQATLFDQLIATTSDGTVPYPFAKLLEHLSQHGQPLSVLIPLGRSQQRHQASFQDPRRVVGFRSRAVDGIHARLFLGYTEKAEQIEVMSLRDGQTEFDFQLVDNYRAASKPVVKTANRNVCLSCHQHGGPIFTPTPWAETNFDSTNSIVPLLLKELHPHGSIDSIPIAQPRGRTSFEFDLLVGDASDLLFDNKLWRTGCSTSKQAAVCRANLLKKLFNRAGLTPSRDFNLSKQINHPDETISDRNLASMIIPDRFVAVNDLSPPDFDRHLTDYQMSEEALSILKRGVNKRKQINQHGKRSPLTMLITYMLGEHLVRGNAPALLTRFELSAAERRVLYEEMANIMMHIHSKDTHLNSSRDPTVKRQDDFQPPSLQFTTTGLDRDTGTLIDFVRQKRRNFVLPTLLARNKPHWDVLDLKSFIIDRDNITLQLYGRSSTEFMIRPSFTVAKVKNKTPKAITYVAKKLSPPYLIITELHVVLANNSAARPEQLSRAVFSNGKQQYEFDLLCRSDPSKVVVHHCAVFDQWQVEEAITKMLQDKSSPLYHDHMQPVAIIDRIRAELLGHRATSVAKQQTHDAETDSADHKVYTPSSDDPVGQALYKHCGSCHSHRDDAYNFLYASQARELCVNIRNYIYNSELRKEDRDLIYTLTSEWMPPTGSEEATSFSTTERNKLVEALRNDRLTFCD